MMRIRTSFLAVILLFITQSPSWAQETPERAGAQVVLSICTACHGLKYVKYQDLMSLGLSAAEVDGLRGDKALFEPIQPLTPPDAAVFAYGVAPPDLSLMVSAREGGTDYIYEYLTGYYIDDQGFPQNRVYPGTRMPDALGISVAEEDSSRSDIEKSARDVAAFLAWAADPNRAKRKLTGVFVLSYLLILVVLLYLSKQRIWRSVKMKKLISS